VAAAIEHGSWLPPQLVTIPAPRPQAQPHAISPAILDTLRPMMRAVVTTGTAADGGFGGDSADLIANALLRNL
jgi:cell division protein FtsI/penicillin-binding protein 2